MSLIKCMDCGKEISDSSDICVHCGCPIIDESQYKRFNFDEMIRPSYKRKAYYANVRALFFLLNYFCSFIYFVFWV